MIDPNEIKHAGDTIGVFTTVGAVIEILPAISAALTSIWFIIRIYQELKTIRRDDD